MCHWHSYLAKLLTIPALKLQSDIHSFWVSFKRCCIDTYCAHVTIRRLDAISWCISWYPSEFLLQPRSEGPLEGDSFHCCQPQVTKVSDQGTCDATLATICVVHFLGTKKKSSLTLVRFFIGKPMIYGHLPLVMYHHFCPLKRCCRGTESCWWQHSDHSGMMKWPSPTPR